MNKEFVKVEVEDLWIWREYPDWPKSETGNKFNRPTKDRKYIKILAKCLTYAPASVIYPGVKNPLMHQVRDMCRAGLLERFKRTGDRKYYYKTTRKGQDLIIKALEVR